MTNENGCPEDVLGWIAWYPDDGLSDEERGAVEAHAAGCASCRRELEMLTDAADPANEPLPDEDRLFARVLTKIETERPSTGSDSASPESRSLHVVDSSPEVTSEIAPASTSTADWRRPLLALAAGVVLTLLAGAGSGLFTTGTSASPGVEPSLAASGGDSTAIYLPASDAGAIASDSGQSAPMLTVIFQPNRSFAEITRSLDEVGGQIISGPTDLGAFQVRLGPEADPREAALRLKTGAASTALLAEPVLDSGSSARVKPK